MDLLVEQFREHIREDSVEDSALSFYLVSARRYVIRAAGVETDYLVIMVAGIMYEYRIAEEEMKKALDAITPFIVQEAYYAETTD